MQVNSFSQQSPHSFPTASRYTTSSTTVASAADSNKTCQGCLSAPKSSQTVYSGRSLSSAPQREIRGIEEKTNNPWLVMLGL